MLRGRVPYSPSEVLGCRLVRQLMGSPIVVRLRYPRFLREKAEALASIFEAPGVKVELVEDVTDEIIIEGPTFVTRDPTVASALLARHMLKIKGNPK